LCSTGRRGIIAPRHQRQGFMIHANAIGKASFTAKYARPKAR
jgi:hypothetical protein